MAGMSGSLTWNLIANADKYVAGMNKAAAATKAAGKHQEQMTRQTKLLRGAVAAVSAAAIVKFGSDSVKAFKEAEVAQAKLAQAYTKFPKLADVNIDAMREMNSELQKVTVYEDDATAAMQSRLAMYDLTGQQLKELTPLVMDYATATGQDLASAGDAVGKALLGNTRALKSVGISYKATGDRAQDYANIQELLNEKVGGFAEAEGKTAAGQAAILANAYGDLQESVGEALLPALQAVVDVTTPLLQSFNELPKGVKTATVVLGALGTAALVAAPRLVALKTLMADTGAAGGKMGGALKGVGAFMGGPWGIALAGATVALGAYMQAQANAKEAVDALTASMNEQTGAATAATFEAVADALSQDIALEDWERIPFTMAEVTSALVQGGPALEALRARLDAFVESTDVSTVANQRAVGIAKSLGSAIENQNEVLYDARRQWQTHTAAQEAAALAAQKAGVAIDGVSESADKAAGAVGDVTTALNNLPTSKTVTITIAGQTMRVPGIGKATGGPIVGPGSGTSDSVPIMASNGEWVIKASSARKYGPRFMSAVNAGTLPRFASGGQVRRRQLRQDRASMRDSIRFGNSAVDAFDFGAYESAVDRAAQATRDLADAKAAVADADTAVADARRAVNRAGTPEEQARAAEQLAEAEKERTAALRDQARAQMDLTRAEQEKRDTKLTGANVASSFKDRARKLDRFRRDLMTLKKRGLAPGLLKEILDAGLDEGGAMARALVADGNIAELNATWRSITADSAALARAFTPNPGGGTSGGGGGGTTGSTGSGAGISISLENATRPIVLKMDSEQVWRGLVKLKKAKGGVSLGLS